MSKDKTGWDKYRRGPVRANTSELTVTIDSLGNNGDGIARHDGKVVFVPLTLPGERVRIKPVTRKKSFIRAQVLETLESSEVRQTPPCEYFGRCGGCDWQHAPYPMQLDAKVQSLTDSLVRIGKLDNPTINPIVASEAIYHYRNRIQGVIKGGRFHYRHRGSDQMLAINSCTLAEDAINAHLGDEAALSQGPQGRVEIASTDDGVSVLPINEENSTEAGFRQVNTAVASRLALLLDTVSAPLDTDSCIDLYCGRGTWSIDIAQRHPHSRVIGIDASEDNIRLAREQSLETGLTNLRFQQGRVESIMKSLPLTNSFCIVDPPRAGLATTVCSALCENPPRHIVYISCHPASLARDLALLTADRFKLTSVTPLDMFPQTAHLETLSLLSRVD